MAGWQTATRIGLGVVNCNCN